MKKRFLLLVLVFLFLGCSPKVRFESTKPIKIDVTMRVDVYQHIAQQADMIESQIESSVPQKSSQNKPQSKFVSFVAAAYAQESLSPKLQAVIQSRKERYPQLRSWESQGVIGEGYTGLVVLRKKPDSKEDLEKVEKIIADENKDRTVIFADFAEENGISIEEAGIVYSERIKSGAPQGTPLEVEENGKRKWVIK